MRKTERRRQTGRPPPAQVLLRGLSVLEALNRQPVSTVEHLADATGLPKPTVVRMLGHLVSAAYVQRLPRRRGYMLDERVLALSAGYRSPDAVVRMARPHLSAFTAEHKWPVTIATLDVDAMRNRGGTLQQSPFTTQGDHGRMSRRVPMLTSALGRAYLAFCPPDERETIVALLQASARKDDLPARDEQFLASLLGSIRRAGYAVSAPLPDDPAIGLAIPVQDGARVLACITLRYLGRAISEKEVARRFLAPLRATAGAIAAAVAERDKLTGDAK
jgi:IclR family transcriptional regulator, mhp operon transcriptional activator